jgi:hypothetical protein
MIEFRNNKYIGIVFILLSINSCSVSESLTNMERSDFKGKVKTVKEINVYPGIPTDSNIVSVNFQTNLLYDTNGNLIEKNIYFSNGKLEIKEIIFLKFTKNNQISEKLIVDTLPERNMADNQKEIYTYNNRGNITSINYYNNDKPDGFKTFKYSSKMLREKTAYYFDSTLIQKGLFKYFHGKIKEELYQDLNSGTIKYKWKYDLYGNKSDLLVYYDDSLARRSVLRYDTRGNVLECNTFDHNGNMTNYYLAKYDEKGNLVEKANFYLKSPFLTKWIYYYDEHGNWVEERTLKDTIITQILKREIHYYSN